MPGLILIRSSFGVVLVASWTICFIFFSAQATDCLFCRPLAVCSTINDATSSCFDCFSLVSSNRCLVFSTWQWFARWTAILMGSISRLQCSHLTFVAPSFSCGTPQRPMCEAIPI
uniref:Putative secreted peptide n=1 Tax=Anopheles braziliensis TaxID=58242 RepID=A0A2M3ZV78_9DIPT